MQQIEVALLDEQGRMATASDLSLTAEVTGQGEFKGIENGCGFDVTSYASHERPTWRGRAIVYVRKVGSVQVRLSAPGLQAVTLTL